MVDLESLRLKYQLQFPPRPKVKTKLNKRGQCAKFDREGVDLVTVKTVHACPPNFETLIGNFEMELEIETSKLQIEILKKISNLP